MTSYRREENFSSESYDPPSPNPGYADQPLLQDGYFHSPAPSPQFLDQPRWTRAGPRYSPEMNNEPHTSRHDNYNQAYYGSSAAAYNYEHGSPAATYNYDHGSPAATYNHGHGSSAAAYNVYPSMPPSQSFAMKERPFTPPFVRAESRADSLASAPTFGNQNDYDSVYQLWRLSGTAADFEKYYANNASSIALDKKVDRYRNGADEPSPQLGYHARKMSKGPKDYRAAGLEKYGPGKDKRMSTKKKWLIVLGVAVGIAVVAAAVVVCLFFFVFNKHKNSGSGTSGSGSSGSSGKQLATWGTNGSVIDLGNGTTFTYINNFGGHWVSEPLNNTAQAQNYTPPLNQEFDFAKNRILGVNLGGWLVTEPFIVPGLYEPYMNDSSPVLDEYMLSQRYLAEGGPDNLKAKMTVHYDTFITEQDFARIAAAGLNWVRIPIGFWAFETYANEPFLEGVSWGYVLKAIQWARKYGLRVNLDLHSVPGSQNGYNHSGRVGFVNFLQGLMGKSNGERTKNYIRQIAEFISQPEIRPVVPIFSIINEPFVITIGQPAMETWYSDIYTMVRNITGTGAGNGPYISIHDGFLDLSMWSGFLAGGDRIIWDTHPYICFADQNNDPWPVQALKPCSTFMPDVDTTRINMGVAIGGEMSLAINDCGLFLNGVGVGNRYDGTYKGTVSTVAGTFPAVGSCATWADYENYSAATKAGLRQFALASMDSLHDFFFWTWRIGNSIRTGKPTAPMWSYSLGLEQGWMPLNPQEESVGACASVAAAQATTVPTTAFGGTFLPWQTGKAAAYAPSLVPSPASLMSANTPLSVMPSYTATMSPTPVPSPTLSMTATVAGGPTAAPQIGNWFNSADTAPYYTRINGCNYPPDQYNLTGWTPTGWPCHGGARKREEELLSRAEPTWFAEWF